MWGIVLCISFWAVYLGIVCYRNKLFQIIRYPRLSLLPFVPYFLVTKKHTAVHILVMIANQLDLSSGNPSPDEVERRLSAWERRYPESINRHYDADGARPRHTWFLSPEEHDEQRLLRLSRMCFNRLGEIEASDMPRGMPGDYYFTKARTCGAHEYFDVSKKSVVPAYVMMRNGQERVPLFPGCFAEVRFLEHEHSSAILTSALAEGKTFFSFPVINGVNWFEPRNIVYPDHEAGEITPRAMPGRLRSIWWVHNGSRVEKNTQWVFVVVAVRGADPGAAELMLGKSAQHLYNSFENLYNDGNRFCTHYVTAREMANIASAAVAGKIGNPHMYRDWVVPPYVNQQVMCTRPWITDALLPDETALRVVSQETVTVTLRGRPLIEAAGKIRSIRVKQEQDGLRITAEGAGAMTATVNFARIPTHISGARIISIVRQRGGGNHILFETMLAGSHEIIIK
jgi:hypothetical protein